MDHTLCNLDRILQKAGTGSLTRQEIELLLQIDKRDQLELLFETACHLRDKHFGKKIFLYGFVYFSTFCRNDCAFCFYRRSNDRSYRYRKSADEVIAAAERLAESGVHLIDLTSGEDPLMYQDDNCHSFLIDLIEGVKKHTGLSIMVSPGVVADDVLQAFVSAGADWYACYQETYNRELFRNLRLHQDYDLRYITKKQALNRGLLVEEGILCGVGETVSDLAFSFEMMRELGAHQVRVMSFVPQQGTPMEGMSTPSRLNELKIIAVLRILFPDRLIPASLDVDGITGLRSRIEAGANVVTSIIPPSLGLAGVAQSKKDIDAGYRTVQGVLPELDNMGLRAASREDYAAWVLAERGKLRYRSGKIAGVCQ
ncbi:MAG TPA: methylornithine synthase PylB [Syntrophaceticus sp.]|nr:methylornithine synthase PylB [Syntrophaceticus sp.]